MKYYLTGMVLITVDNPTTESIFSTVWECINSGQITSTVKFIYP